MPMLRHSVDCSNMTAWQTSVAISESLLPILFTILGLVAIAYAMAHMVLGRSHLLPALFFFLGVVATAFAVATGVAHDSEALTLGMCVVGATFFASSAYLHVHRSPK